MATTEVAVPGAVLLTGEEVVGLFRAAWEAYTQACEAQMQEWYLGFQTMRDERFYYEETYVLLTTLALLAKAQAYRECRSRYAAFWRWVPIAGHNLEKRIVPEVVARGNELYWAACKEVGLPSELTSWDKPRRWHSRVGKNEALVAAQWERVRALLTLAQGEPTRQYVVPVDLLGLLVVEEGS